MLLGVVGTAANAAMARQTVALIAHIELTVILLLCRTILREALSNLATYELEPLGGPNNISRSIPKPGQLCQPGVRLQIVLVNSGS
jgi:hypothetical protein